ncbi:unnamed protein product [Caenorhabditis angaria]|uniref:NAD-dependent epimerase/dehydratase domain-containing protein n=1 Tax=Caenorhabditis angaria TaxID=860376 RepID=A0A9P1IPB1_9PELO|nr:unnamed protein product [Caenorhabditis angaria]
MQVEWKSQSNSWDFYRMFNISRISPYFLEFLVMIHVYFLAAWLAIREFIFDLQIPDEIFLQKIQSFPRKSGFALVTGADGTIGSEIVKILLENEYKIIGLVQKVPKNPEDYPQNLKFLECDFSKREDIRKVSEKIANKNVDFDLAIFTAGVMLVENLDPKKIETHIQINVISQAYLFNLLSSKITRSIFLSSATSRVALYSQPINLKSQLGPYQAYSTSKLYLAKYIEHLSHKNSNLKIVSCHPGTVPGKLYRHANIVVKTLSKILLPWILRRPKRAAILVLATICSEDLKSGKYYEDLEIFEICNDFEVFREIDIFLKGKQE